MKILAIGDVVGIKSVDYLSDKLFRIKSELAIDFTVINGENASEIHGVSKREAKALFDAGADVITGGNHTLRNKAVYTYLDEEGAILRPVNFGDGAPGRGYGIYDAKGFRILVINALGNIYMDPVLDSPFSYIEKVLRGEKGRYDLAVLDIHAEATGEKLAVAYAFDGEINVVFGTHTHVPTADGRILPRGTGYISDLGMCGESGGVLGMEPLGVVERMRTHLSRKFSPASGKVIADGVIFTVDTSSGRVTDIERIEF